LDLICEAIVASGRREIRKASPGRWLTAPRRVVVLVAATVFVGGGVAAATGLFVPTPTGVYQNAAGVRMGGPGELLNTSGTDFRRVALQLSIGIPYPPGYQGWRRWVLPAENLSPAGCSRGSPQGDCSVRVSTGAVRGWFAMSAFTAWVIDWWRAMHAGDTARAARDAQVIAEAPNWDAVRAEDPRPLASMPGDLGSTDTSLFGWILPYVPAIQAGDVSRVDQLLDSDLYGGMFGIFDPGWDRLLHREAHAPRPLAGYVSYLKRSGQ
jgi:hypothetical protein